MAKLKDVYTMREDVDAAVEAVLAMRWHRFWPRKPRVALAPRMVALLRWARPDERDAAMSPAANSARGRAWAQRLSGHTPGDGS